MRLKIQKVMSVVLLAAFISGSAFALAPKQTEVQENLIIWTRVSLDENEWVQGEGGLDPCIEASLICQLMFPAGYDPNLHDYTENESEGQPPLGGVQDGYKPALAP